MPNRKTFLRAFLSTLSVLLILSAVFLAGYLARDWLHPTTQLPILNQARDLLLQRGLKSPPPDPALEYGMVHGMVQAYGDPYTIFVEPPQHELETDRLQGSYGGIGVQMSTDPDGYWVLFPFPDSPAQKAGVQEGDRLLAVDDLPVEPGTPTDTIQAAVRGPVGSQVNITVGRAPDYQPQVLSIERAEISLPSVTSRIEPGYPWIGVIDVNLIAASTPDEIQRTALDLQKRGATHFVLDVRDNPGGLLTAGVDIARLFLKDGIVIQQQYRGQEAESYRVEKAGPLADLPLVVLVNQGSASAAEIAAGAIQAHQRAPLIGAQTYGKDTIQLIFELQDKSSLHVTAAHWWVPGLDPPLSSGNGLLPDIFVEASTEANPSDTILQAAIQYLETQR